MPQRRTHPLTVRIDREIFERVRAVLAVDYPPVRARDDVAVGAWPTLIEQILIDWLAKHHDRKPTWDRSLAPHNKDNR